MQYVTYATRGPSVKTKTCRAFECCQSNWKKHIQTPLKLEQQLGKRENILAEVDAETRWMEDIGLMLT